MRSPGLMPRMFSNFEVDMQILRDLLAWLGVGASGLSNWQLLLGLFMTLFALAIVVFLGRLAWLYVKRWHAEEAQKTHKACVRDSEEGLRAAKRVAEARIQRAKLEADAVQAERSAQERMDGPRREMEKLRTEVAELKRLVTERDAVVGERDAQIESLKQEVKNLKDKLDIEEKHRRNAMLQIDDISKQYDEAVQEAEIYRQRLAEVAGPAPERPEAPAPRRSSSGGMTRTAAPTPKTSSAAVAAPLVVDAAPAPPATPAAAADVAPAPASPAPLPPPAGRRPPSGKQQPPQEAASLAPAAPRPRRTSDTLEDVEGAPAEDVSAPVEPSGEDHLAESAAPHATDPLPGRANGF